MQKSYNNIQETATCMNSYTKVHDQIFQRIYWPKQCQKMPNGLCKKTAENNKKHPKNSTFSTSIHLLQNLNEN